LLSTLSPSSFPMRSICLFHSLMYICSPHTFSYSYSSSYHPFFHSNRPKCSRHRNYGKTTEPPNRPYEKERLDQEMKLLGEYGLRCKREIWRSQLALAKIRSAARKLLTLDEKDPKRMFEGEALLRRMVRYGMLSDAEKRLDAVLSLSTQHFLERRLQTKVYKLNIAKSVHHARCLILQRHIRVGSQLVNSPSFMVRTSSEGNIDFALASPFNAATGKKGRVARKRAKSTKADE